MHLLNVYTHWSCFFVIMWGTGTNKIWWKDFILRFTNTSVLISHFVFLSHQRKRLRTRRGKGTNPRRRRCVKRYANISQHGLCENMGTGLVYHCVGCPWACFGWKYCGKLQHVSCVCHKQWPSNGDTQAVHTCEWRQVWKFCVVASLSVWTWML